MKCPKCDYLNWSRDAYCIGCGYLVHPEAARPAGADSLHALGRVLTAKFERAIEDIKGYRYTPAPQRKAAIKQLEWCLANLRAEIRKHSTGLLSCCEQAGKPPTAE